MTISMEYQKVGSERFARSFNKLTNAQLPLKTAYRVKKMTDKLESVRKQIRDEFQKLVDTHGERGEDGKVILEQGGNGFKVREDAKEAYAAEEKAFDAKKADLACEKLNVLELSAAGLTATDLVALEDVLDLSGLEDDQPKAPNPLSVVK